MSIESTANQEPFNELSERYKTSAIYRTVVNALTRGTDQLTIINSLVDIIDTQNSQTAKLIEGIPVMNEFLSRYPMCKDQPAQIDCTVNNCKYNKGAGRCSNISPAISLNANKSFVCWSFGETVTTK